MTYLRASGYLVFLCVAYLALRFLVESLLSLLGFPGGLGGMVIAKLILASLLLVGVLVTGVRREAGLIAKINWRVLPLYWPVACIVLLAVAGADADVGATPWARLALLALAVGFIEELMFRGLVFYWFNSVGDLARVLISAIAFGALHLAGLLSDIAAAIIVAQVFFAAGLGVVFACARLQDYSILLSIAMHALFDFAVIGGRGGVAQTFGDAGAIVPGLVIGGLIAWSWGGYLLWRLARKSVMPMQLRRWCPSRRTG